MISLLIFDVSKVVEEEYPLVEKTRQICGDFRHYIKGKRINYITFPTPQKELSC